MYHSGIGGGGFAIVRDSDGNFETIDYREAAPAAAYEDMFNGNLPGAVVGGLSVAVPGDLKGLEYIHKKHGVRFGPVLPFTDLDPLTSVFSFCHGERL